MPGLGCKPGACIHGQCRSPLSESKNTLACRSFLLVIFCIILLHNNVSRATDIIRYNVEIYEINNSKTMTQFVCEDNEKVCRETIPVEFGSTHRAVDVISLFEPGNAYFLFSLDGTFLRVGTQNLFHMSLGTSVSTESKVRLAEPLPTALNEDSRSSVISPVLRYSKILTTLHIAVHPLDVYHYNMPDATP
jgi:hypothetical protein